MNVIGQTGLSLKAHISAFQGSPVLMIYKPKETG